MHKDISGCNALFYDEEGGLLANAKILQHNKDENSIEVRDLPALIVGRLCDVLILTSPKPYAYKGRIHKYTENKVVKLFKGQVSCKRRETRYHLDLPAQVESLIYDGKPYPLKTALEARLVNISKSGVRFRSRCNALTVGHRFHLRMKAGEDDKLLTADVVYRKDTPPESSEFGCRLVGQAGDY